MKPDCENRLIMIWPKSDESDALRNAILYIVIVGTYYNYYISLYSHSWYILHIPMANTCITDSIKVHQSAPPCCGALSSPRNFEDGLVCTVQLCHQEIQQEDLRLFFQMPRL